VAANELGRGIRIQTRQVGFGISAVNPLCSNQPNLNLGRFGSHALKIFSLGQKSLARAAGTADPKAQRLAAALEEHCLDNRHALRATGSTRHS
jgi:hypothetical protein